MRTPIVIAILIVAAAIAAFGLISSRAASPVPADNAGAGASGPTAVSVRLFGEEGKLAAPAASARVVKSEAEWKKLLAPETFDVTRKAGTETPGTGALLNEHRQGVFVCADCGMPLFASETKFESGTGWPSFYQPIAKENVQEKSDSTLGMVRTEVLCPRCGAHLGHVFDDGPQPTGLRYCMNSAALRFVPQAELASLVEKPASKETGMMSDNKMDPTASAAANDAKTTPGLAEAVFAGGCFWCVEGVFEQIEGVKDAESGYAGGDASTANYDDVCTGTTGHAESVKITYDPTKVTYEQLLKIHFATHDPTTLNRQGADVGTQYRSAIFYANDDQKKRAQAFIDHLTETKAFGDRKIVTTLEPLKGFYPAETYHQDYACKNPNQPYIAAIAMPKIEKTRTKFADMLKPKAELKP